MMKRPEDPIFTTGKAEGAGSGGGTEGAGGTEGKAAAGAEAAATGPDLDARIEAAVAKATAKLGSSIENTETFIREMSQSLQAGGAGTGAGGFASGSAEEQAWIQRFYDNPEGAVDERFAQSALPIVQHVARAHTNLQLDKFSQEIDSEWGAGAFDGVIRKPLQSLIDTAIQGNPTAALNQEGLQTALASIAYRSRRALAEHKEKAQTQSQQAENERFNAQMQAALREQGIDTTTLRGGIRRVAPVDDKLPNELHAYLAANLRETGREIDEKRAAKMMRTGNKLSDWQKSDKELGGGQG